MRVTHAAPALFGAALLCLATPLAEAMGGGSHGSCSSDTQGKSAAGVQRDAHGKSARSPQALRQFKKVNPSSRANVNLPQTAVAYCQRNRR